MLLESHTPGVIVLRRLFLPLTLLLLCAAPAFGQAVPDSSNVVSACGTPNTTYTVGRNQPDTVDQNGNKCTNTGGGVQPTPVAVTVTNCGGTLTTGGTAQNAAASNASRKGGWIQNPVSATEDLYVSFTTSATVNGAGNQADLAAGQSVGFSQSGTVVTAAVSVNATTTGHRYICASTQ